VTNMDAGLNKNVGIAIRSFYKPLLRPTASEAHLVIAGKICTLCFGAVIVGLALLVNRFRETNLFDFLNQLSANLVMPLALPLIYGMFFKRTPGWSGWSTALVAGVASLVLGHYFSPALVQEWMGWTLPFNESEATYLRLGVTTLGGTVLAGSVWYFFTSLFYEGSSVEHREEVEKFFLNLRTPVEKTGVEGVQSTLYKLLGGLCLVYGGFILLLILIPFARLPWLAVALHLLLQFLVRHAQLSRVHPTLQRHIDRRGQREHDGHHQQPTEQRLRHLRDRHRQRQCEHAAERIEARLQVQRADGADRQRDRAALQRVRQLAA